MRPVIIITGLFLVVVGTASIRFPHRMRNHVSSREWEANPEKAKQKQLLYARIVGVFLIFGLGCMLIFAGIVL
jgi:uncharacterized membrane protein